MSSTTAFLLGGATGIASACLVVRATIGLVLRAAQDRRYKLSPAAIAEHEAEVLTRRLPARQGWVVQDGQPDLMVFRADDEAPIEAVPRVNDRGDVFLAPGGLDHPRHGCFVAYLVSRHDGIAVFCGDYGRPMSVYRLPVIAETRADAIAFAAAEWERRSDAHRRDRIGAK
jgi:hypothetical protein